MSAVVAKALLVLLASLAVQPPHNGLAATWGRHPHKCHAQWRRGPIVAGERRVLCPGHRP